MPEYDPRCDDVRDMLNEVLEEFRHDLLAAEVTIGLLKAWPTKEGETDTVVKLNGYPCAATVQITGYKERCKGVQDAVIVVDGNTWKEMSQPKRRALIHHEIAHLLLVKDKDGELKSDRNGRPCLKMRLHDWNLGGFRDIAEIHGSNALEVQAFRIAAETFRQQVFRFTDDMAPQDEMPREAFGDRDDDRDSYRPDEGA